MRIYRAWELRRKEYERGIGGIEVIVDLSEFLVGVKLEPSRGWKDHVVWLHIGPLSIRFVWNKISVTPIDAPYGFKYKYVYATGEEVPVDLLPQKYDKDMNEILGYVMPTLMQGLPSNPEEHANQ